MEEINAQPLAFVHNNEVICVEGNTPNVQKKFSSFKVFELKGPIDVNYLLNSIFPPSERDFYDLEVSEYNGKSAKVKFNFTDRTHTDLIQQLRDSAGKFFNVSENGLVDWVASDTITFRSIYRNTDGAASQQLRIDKVLSYNNSNASFTTTTTATTTTTTTTTSSSSSSNQADLQLHPIIDEKAIEQELNELSKRIHSQSSLKNYELERLIHSTVQRRDMTITINDLSDEYFSQVRNVVTFIGNNSPDTFIKDNLLLDSNTIVHSFARFLFKHVETVINSRTEGVIGFAKDYKFGIILTVWNLINAFHSIQDSYQVLIEADEGFKNILKSHKKDFMSYLSNIDKTLMDLLIILYDEIDEEKYERLQLRLELFVKAAEDLMRLVMIINNQCNEELEKLENQEKDLSTKLYTAAIMIGLSAIVIGGYMYNNKKKEHGKYEKMFGQTALCATGIATTATMYKGYSRKIELQGVIKQQAGILEQLFSAYKELKNWKNLGKNYIKKDINDMNNNRMTLVDEFVRIRIQCKCLGQIFDLLDDNNNEERKTVCG